MTENRGKILKRTRLRIPTFTRDVQKRFVKVTLTLLAAFLTFGGPTYLMYVVKRWGIPPFLLVLLGLASLITGLILFTRLIGEEKKSEASA